jgi:uncharacterized membrane protein
LRDRSESIVALFDSTAVAESAARRVEFWTRSNPLAVLNALGVLAKTDDGSVSVQRLGPRETRRGAGIGLLAGALIVSTRDGLNTLEGLALGAVGGGAVGSLFRKDLRLSAETRSRIALRLHPGGAAVLAVVPAWQAGTVGDKLIEYGGTLEDAGTASDPAPAGSAEPAPSPL